MRQPGTARLLVRRSGVAARDWARALGCTTSAMHKLLEDNPKMQSGPVMQRLNSLLDGLRDGRAHWQRDPNDLSRPGRRRSVLVREPPAPEPWKPGAVMRIDPFHLKLTLVSIGTGTEPTPKPPAEPPTVNLWNPYRITYCTPGDEEREWLRRTRGREPENPRWERGQGSTFDPPGSTLPHRRMRRG